MEAFCPCQIPGALGAGFGREGLQPPFMKGETETPRMSTPGASHSPGTCRSGCCPAWVLLKGPPGLLPVGALYCVPGCWGECLTGDRKYAHLPISEPVPGQFSIQPVPSLPGPRKRDIGHGGVQGEQTLCLEVRVPFWCCHFLAV